MIKDTQKNQSTSLHLYYRDADNHKTGKTIVLPGEINQQQVDAIKDKFVDGYFVIAHQIGLPTVAKGFIEKGFSFPTESDHVYTTVAAFEDKTPTAADLLTDEPPNVDMSIEQLVENILNVQWDELAEVERLGLPI